MMMMMMMMMIMMMMMMMNDDLHNEGDPGALDVKRVKVPHNVVPEAANFGVDPSSGADPWTSAIAP